MLKPKWLAVALFGILPVSLLHAASIDISTGVANWQLTGVTDLSSVTTPYSVPGETLTTNPDVIAPNGGWVSTSAVDAVDPSAQWISASTQGASDGIWGWYTYTLTLTAPPLTPGTYKISGVYSSDNMVDSFSINTQQYVNSTPTGNIFGFDYIYSVSASAVTPITITARVYNESENLPSSTELGTALENPDVTYAAGPSLPDGTANPTGFILAGTATLIVPMPASVWTGGVLCGILGMFSLRKRNRVIS